MKLKDPNSTDSFSIDFSTTNHSNLQQEHGGVTKTQWRAYSFNGKFGVGDEFIHELSMALDDFPVKS